MIFQYRFPIPGAPLVVINDTFLIREGGLQILKYCKIEKL